MSSTSSTPGKGMAYYNWGDTGNPLPSLDFVCVDRSWTKLLPEGSEITSNVGHVSSYWSQTGKIQVRLRDGTSKRYFIKLTETPLGRLMVEGEYESMKALKMVVPEMIPEPYGWGTFETQQDLHFFLCDFVDMYDEEQPPMEDFCHRIADMHKRSQPMNPNPGYYGFPVNTPNGIIEQPNIWRSSWEHFFAEKLRCALDQEIAKKGTTPEYDALWTALFEKVVPRLLRPLETGRNSIVPSLTHGDLWYANTARRAVRSDPPVMFDASAMWAHNEYDLHCWRGDMHLFNQSWSDEYLRHYPPSEPKEDVNDRISLYALTSALHNSIAFKPPRWRQLIVDAVQQLVDKFPEGYTGPHRRKDDDRPDSAKGGPDDTVTGKDSLGQQVA